MPSELPVAANGSDVLLAKLGQHKTGKVCVYIRRLANVDLKVLEKLIARSVAETKSRYPQPNENDAQRSKNSCGASRSCGLERV